MFTCMVGGVGAYKLVGDGNGGVVCGLPHEGVGGAVSMEVERCFWERSGGVAWGRCRSREV
jgi:hypothetical protein